MAAGRIRSIKPELLDDKVVAALSSDAWRAFVSMFLLADDYGNLRASPKQLEGAMFWNLAGERDWPSIVAELTPLVLFWEDDGQEYAHIRNWLKHQKVDHPGKPRCKAPPPELLPESSRQSRATPSTLSRESSETLDALSREQEVAVISPSSETVARPARDPRESVAPDLRSPISDLRSPTTTEAPPEDGPLGGAGLCAMLTASGLIVAQDRPEVIAKSVLALKHQRTAAEFREAVVSALNSLAVACSKDDGVVRVGPYLTRTMSNLLAAGGLEADRQRSAPRDADGAVIERGEPSFLDAEYDRLIKGVGNGGRRAS